MFDFRSKTPPPAYHGRVYQRRLIYLMGGLVLVLYAMWHARDPKHWKWFEVFTQPRVAEVDTTAPASPPGQDPSQAQELAEAFVAPGKRQIEKPDVSKPLAERVRPELLKSVSDNIAGFDPKEADAFFHLLEILGGAEPEAIRAARAEPVTHLQLWEQSAAYRGKLVSMTGSIRRALPRTLPANDYGVSQYYEVWLRPDGTTNPVVIYALQLPANFPVRAEMDEPASVTGFYYRRWWYMAGDEKKPDTVKARRAPMLLARTLDWSPRPPPTDLRTRSSNLEWLFWVAGGAMLVIVLGVVLLRRYSREQPPDYIRARMKKDDLSDIPGDAGKRDVSADLERLSQADHESDQLA